MPAKGSGQGRGNSGIFLMGKYEIQVLDSYDNETYHDGQAGAIYKQTPPAVNAHATARRVEQLRHFLDGTAVQRRRRTALARLHHGGAQWRFDPESFRAQGRHALQRPPKYKPHDSTGPISIQDHGNPVRFRNIWVREFKPASGEQVREPFIRDGDKETPVTSE